jgi:hypothetical protein
MQDLAMISLELLQNSIAAKASKINFTLALAQDDGTSTMIIEDDGCGMDEATVAKISSPFYTSRTTRKVGLGVAFFKQAIQQANGSCQIISALNLGTTIKGTWESNHWDAPPVGNIGETILILIQGYPNIHLMFNFSYLLSVTSFDSKMFEASIAPVSISEPAILRWIESEINTNIQHCKGGINHEES